MLAIKLSRIGKKKQPSYRLIVVEKHKDPWGDYLERVGIYNPRTKPKTIEFDAERIKYWIGKGAQPTATVHNLLVDAKIIEGEKINTITISKKRRAKKEGADAAKKEESTKKAATEENKKSVVAEEVKLEEKPTTEEAKPQDQPKEEVKNEPTAA